MVRLTDIYCLIHGAVHGPNPNPYDCEDDRCCREEWRPIYWRARKKDDPS